MGVARIAAGPIACALALSACSQPDVVSLTRWNAELPDGTGAVVTLPTHLNRQLPPRPAVYWLRTAVELPPSLRDRPLTLGFVQLPARCTAFANDVELMALDPQEPGSSSYRVAGAQRWRIPAEQTQRGVFQLALRIEHRWTQSAWLDTVPRLSATMAGDSRLRFIDTANRVMANGGLATALAVAALYGVVFFLDRRRSGAGWIALEALVAASYPAFQLGITIPVLKTFDAPVMSILLDVAIWASIRFAHAQFQLGPPHRLVDVCLLIGLVSFCVGWDPFWSTRIITPVTVTVVMLNIFYQMAISVYLWRRTESRTQAGVLLVSWAVLGLIGSVDFVAWMGFGELAGGLRGASLGIVGIAMLQSAVLGRDHVTVLRTADQLNTELAARVEMLESRNREVGMLNDELRRQIAGRSERLATALSRLAGAQKISPPPLEAGSVLESRYRVLRSIGSGAMGTVYETERMQDQRRLALKILTARNDALALARFAREAQIIAELHHPNVVSIVDVDVGEAGYFYIVMEYVDGQSLRQHKERVGELPWCYHVVAQIGRGLGAIHSRGFLHRDLKPENVLVGAGAPLPAVKIADFGISTGLRRDVLLGSVRRGSETTLTQGGIVMGTPRYMAPELADGIEHAAPASDVFSLGIIAYELLTGQFPFSEAPVVLRMMDAELPPPRPIPSGISAQAAELLLQTLAAEPAARPPADEVARVFAHFAATCSAARVVSPASVDSPRDADTIETNSR